MLLRSKRTTSAREESPASPVRVVSRAKKQTKKELSALKVKTLFYNHYWDYNFQTALKQVMDEAAAKGQLEITQNFVKDKWGPSGIIDIDAVQVSDQQGVKSGTIAVRKTIRPRDAKKGSAQKATEETVKEFESCEPFNVLRSEIPNFMYTYAANYDNNEVFFEYIEGKNVAKFFKELPGAVPTSQVSTVTNIMYSMVVQMAFSLHTMRRYDLFHNDLHPYNIILRPCASNVFIEYKYVARDKSVQKVYVPTFGFITTLIDFGESTDAKRHCNNSDHLGYDFTKFLLHLISCAREVQLANRGPVLTQSASIDLTDQIVYTLKTLTSGTLKNNIKRLRKSKEIIIDMKATGKFDEEFGYCFSEDYFDSMFMANCSSQPVLMDPVELLQNLSLIDPNIYYRSTQLGPPSGPVIGCLSERCTIQPGSFVDLMKV
jgi:hypothetical protein